MILKHENVATTFACATTKGGIPFLVMEFLPGQSLDELIQSSGAVELKTFHQVFLQVLSGLAHAHSSGIVHRDLKPGNIVLVPGASDRLTPKIVDFGIAKLLEGRDGGQKITRTGAVVGSPAYMSPEQWTGQLVAARSDIYSLGCVMYQALTGQLPYQGANAFAYLEQHLQTEIVPPSIVSKRMLPQGLDELILKMTAKAPEERYQSCEAVLADFSKLNFDRLVAPAPDVKPNRQVKEGRKWLANKARLTWTLGVFGLLLTLGLYLLSGFGGPVGTLDQAQQMFDKGHYSAAARRISGAGPIDFEKLSLPQRTQLLQLEFLLAQALADDHSPEFTTMRRALQEQAQIVPAAAKYGAVLDSILDPRQPVSSLATESVLPGKPRDFYLQSLVLVQQALLAQRAGRNAAAEAAFLQARAAAKRSNRPVRELEVLNSLFTFYRTSQGQKTNRQLVLNAAHKVARQLIPASGYEAARALADLSVVTLKWEQFRPSSMWALRINDSMPLPSDVMTKMAFLRGRNFTGQDEYGKAILEFQKVSQDSPSAALFLRGEALLWEADCLLAQGKTDLGTSKMRQSLALLTAGNASKAAIPDDASVEQLREQIEHALIEVKSNWGNTQEPGGAGSVVKK